MQLAQQAKAIFLGSKLEIKQQILRCIFSNSRLIDEKLHLELHESFSTLAQIKDHSKWWSMLDALRTFNWLKFKEQGILKLFTNHNKQETSQAAVIR